MGAFAAEKHAYKRLIHMCQADIHGGMMVVCTKNKVV